MKWPASLDALALRLVVMLAFALLPLGVIAVYQTSRVVDQVNTLTESALLGRTSEATDQARQQIQRAFGAAKALGQTIQVAGDATGSAACSEFMRGIVDVEISVVWAGFIDAQSQLVCASQGAPRDLRTSEPLQAMLKDPRPTLQSSGRAEITGESVLHVNHPAYRDGEFIGFISLSLLREQMRLNTTAAEKARPANLFLFNQDGDILASDLTETDGIGDLPDGIDLVAYATGQDSVFSTQARSGQERTYTVLSIIPGTLYALGVWAPRQSLIEIESITRFTISFPILMWLVSLTVAYFAVHRQVVRHIQRLRRKMRGFASGNRTIDSRPLANAAEELTELDATFLSMANTISRDEAEMENQLHEKNVLLKEVHHRVKNNLQLISSIINMQVRKSRNTDANRALRQVQDRVLSLATIHRNLYQTENLSAVRADTLVAELVNQMLILALPQGSGVTVDTRYDPVALYPDQAVPLSLLVGEAATNALKYIGRPDSGVAPWLSLRLTHTDEGQVEFALENSIGAQPLTEAVEAGSGLGRQLMRAFAGQLGGEVAQEDTQESHRFSVIFTPVEFDPDDASEAEAQRETDDGTPV